MRSGDLLVASLGSEVSETAPTSVHRWLSTVRSYVALTKPRIIELLLVTTIPTMILAQRGLPSWWLMVSTLVGGAFAAGSANTLNCYLDRDIDQHMDRTKSRPLVTGEITPRNALIFGVVLGVISIGLLGFVVNWLSAGLALSAILFYVVVYTLGLKRRTPSNIVWGGAAGCVPVLIGWSSVTGSLGWAPWILFGIIFWWTPPHYWPLSMKYADDYARVDVPMLGAIADPEMVGQRIVRYSWVMVLWSLLMVPTNTVGMTYTLAAVLLGGWFLVEAHRLHGRARRNLDPKPMRLFGLSITYLTLLFIAVAVDPFVTPTTVWDQIGGLSALR